MRFAHTPMIGRLAAGAAGWGLPPLGGRIPLCGLHPLGYRSPSARVAHDGFSTGRNCFLGDGVVVLRERDGGEARLGDLVAINAHTVIQTGDGGSLSIGARTSIQGRCQFSAYRGRIVIGERVEIAPSCAFYPYNHGTEAGRPIQGQPTWTRGGIVIEDDAWLGYGVIVLDGARIGAGAVIGAGSVVTSEIPPNAIAAGVPARVLGNRSEPTPT
jgi:acetyltransferase-like isoleucine patch superfamily enzyme